MNDQSTVDEQSAPLPTAELSSSAAVCEQNSKPEQLASVSFYDLMKIPTRQRSTRKRQGPPSYTLTSDEHFKFLLAKKPKKGVKKQVHGSDQKNKQKTAKKKKETTSKSKDSEDAMCLCGYFYGDPKDPHATDEWISCSSCCTWFHESCGEDNGVLDDDIFLCKNCCT